MKSTSRHVTGCYQSIVDLDPTALELVDMGLSGCISTIWAMLEADKPDEEPTITSARASVYVDSDEEIEKLDRILERTMRSCPVGRLYEKAGIEIATELSVGEFPGDTSP